MSSSNNNISITSDMWDMNGSRPIDIFNSTQCVCMDLTMDDYSHSYATYNFVVVIICIPIISMLGVFGNLINAYIFAQPKMRGNSSNVYLLALSISDFSTVLTGLVMFWLDSARSYLPWMTSSPYLIVFTLPFSFMAQSCSVYFTVMAAVDCYFKVCWSHRLPNYGTTRTAKKIIAFLIVCSVTFNALRFGQLKLHECITETNDPLVEICATQLLIDTNLWYNVYLSTIVLTVAPFFTLCCLNSLIIIKMREIIQRQRWRRALFHSLPMPARSYSHFQRTLQEGIGPRTVQIVNDNSSDETVTMVMVVLLFLACNILSIFISIYETFFETDELLLNYMTDMSNLLMILNSSVNLLIYLGFCDDFRDIFRARMNGIPPTRPNSIQVGNRSSSNQEQPRPTSYPFAKFGQESSTQANCSNGTRKLTSLNPKRHPKASIISGNKTSSIEGIGATTVMFPICGLDNDTHELGHLQPQKNPLTNKVIKYSNVQPLSTTSQAIALQPISDVVVRRQVGPKTTITVQVEQQRGRSKDRSQSGSAHNLDPDSGNSDDFEAFEDTTTTTNGSGPRKYTVMIELPLMSHDKPAILKSTCV